MQLSNFTEVLDVQVIPTATTPYGQPRTFSATIVNVGLGAAYANYTGNITFEDAHNNVLCTAPVINDASLLGTTVSALQRFMICVLSPCSSLLEALYVISYIILTAQQRPSNVTFMSNHSQHPGHLLGTSSSGA